MKSLLERTTSALPISIGTSLALESLFQGTQAPYDKTRVIPETISVAEYQECYLNVETMIRNIQGAVDRVSFIDSSPQEIVDIILSEIDIIESVFQIEGSDLCRPVFFHNTFKSLRSEYNGRGKFREAQTTIQKAYELKVDQVLKKLTKTSNKVLEFDTNVKPNANEGDRPSALIVTHFPADLLSRKYFKKLDLLESHTGVVKKFQNWNTKYAPVGEDSLSHLPFCKSLLIIFGDRSMIEPLEPKLRRKILDISIKDKWTPFTTESKMKMSYLTHITHPADLQFVVGF